MKFKALLATLAAALTCVPASHAGEPEIYTYHFSVAGVVCGACSKVVKDRISKVDGVTSVKIRKAAEGDLPVMTVESTSSALDAATLQSALGATSGHYQVIAQAAPQPSKP